MAVQAARRLWSLSTDPDSAAGDLLVFVLAGELNPLRARVERPHPS